MELSDIVRKVEKQRKGISNEQNAVSAMRIFKSYRPLIDSKSMEVRFAKKPVRSLNDLSRLNAFVGIERFGVVND